MLPRRQPDAVHRVYAEQEPPEGIEPELAGNELPEPDAAWDELPEPPSEGGRNGDSRRRRVSPASVGPLDLPSLWGSSWAFRGATAWRRWRCWVPSWGS